jgi:hypothetical protein
MEIFEGVKRNQIHPNELKIIKEKYFRVTVRKN